MCEFLCGPWKDTIQRNTKMSLRDVGKGDFNMNIKEYYVFFCSKLYRMLELIKYRMEVTGKTYLKVCIIFNWISIL